ncbi:MAG TPA: hypothetical protein VM347_22630 [Nonomuraea sp.]|nr:hypothetical protein [Nonomuraea sp.]
MTSVAYAGLRGGSRSAVVFLTSADEVRIGWMWSRRGWVVSPGGFVPALARAVAVLWGDLAGGPTWYGA